MSTQIQPKVPLAPKPEEFFNSFAAGLERGAAPKALLMAYNQLNPRAKRQAEINTFRAGDRTCSECNCPMGFRKHPAYEDRAWFHLSSSGKPLVECQQHHCNNSKPKQISNQGFKEHSPGRYYNVLVASWLLYLSPTTLSTNRLFLKVGGSGSSVMLRKNFIMYKLGEQGKEKLAPIGSEWDQKLFSWLFELHDPGWVELTFKIDWSSIYKYGEQLIYTTFANLGLKPEQILEIKIERPTLFKSWKDLRILDLMLPEKKEHVDPETGKKYTEIIPGFPLEYLKMNMLKWNPMSYSRNHYKDRIDKVLQERFLASSHRIVF